MQYIKTERTEYDGKFYRVLCTFEDNDVLSGQFFKFKEEPKEDEVTKVAEAYAQTMSAQKPSALEQELATISPEAKELIKEDFLDELKQAGRIDSKLEISEK